MARRLGFAVVVGGLLLAGPAAEAKILDLYATAHLGGMIGRGASTLEAQSADFFQTTRGGAFGAEVGVEILFVDVFVNHTQVVDGQGLGGTLTQALVGLDMDIPVEDGKKPKTFLRFGFAGGFAFGTHLPVNPPLSNDQISDKGLVAQATLELYYAANDVFNVGFEVDGGYHYFFLGGAAPANDMTNQSHGVQVMGFLTVRAHFEAKGK